MPHSLRGGITYLSLAGRGLQRTLGPQRGTMAAVQCSGLVVRSSQLYRPPCKYFSCTSRHARIARCGGALKYRPIRTIGRLHSGQGNGRSGTSGSHVDDPICLNALRQVKQANRTLFVACGTPRLCRAFAAPLVKQGMQKPPVRAAVVGRINASHLEHGSFVVTFASAD